MSAPTCHSCKAFTHPAFAVQNCMTAPAYTFCRRDRTKLGLLERKKDYKARAEDFHRKERALRSLQRKAEERNPDEFYFAMQTARTRGGVHVKRCAVHCCLGAGTCTVCVGHVMTAVLAMFWLQLRGGQQAQPGAAAAVQGAGHWLPAGQAAGRGQGAPSLPCANAPHASKPARSWAGH